MNNQDKTKDELIKELQKLQLDYDSLKALHKKDITQSKQAEELLKETTERLHEAQKLAHIGVWDWKPDTDTVTWTDELYSIAGLDPMLPAPTYKEHSNLYTPESWELLKTSVEKAMETGESYQLELELIRPNGDTRYVNAFGGPKYDSKGQVIGLFGTVQDITKRKQEEEELALLAHTIRSISESVSVTDQENKILFVNDAFLKTYGYTLEELIGKSISIVRSTTTEPSIDDILRTTFQGGWHGELLNQKKDGTEFPIALSTSSVCNGKGQAIALVGIAMDITERKKAEEMVKTNEEKYRMIFDEAPIGIAISTTEGKIIDINKAQAEMIGCTVEELKGRSIHEYYDYPDKRMEMIELFKKTSKVRDFEMGLKKKDGSIIVEMLNIDQIKIRGKDHIFATGRDITKRKKAEEALQLEKENFRHSLDDSPLGVRIATLEGNTIYANKAILDLYGYDSLEELQITHLKNRYTPESYIQAQERKRQRESGDLSANEYEISIVRKNGEIRHLQVYRNEILWDGVKQFQVIYNDITKRKQAEAALRESEAKFRSLFENSLLGISLARPGSGLLQVNLAYARMYGYENPEVLLAEVHDTGILFAKPEERKEVLRELQMNGFMEAREFELIRRDGSHFFVLVSACEIRDSDGRLLYNMATHIDLSERKKDEEKMRASSLYARNLIETSLDPFFTINAEGKVTDVNKATEQITGIKRKKLIGSDFADYFTEPEKARKGYKIVFSKGAVKDYHLTILHTSGRKVDVLYNATLFKNEAGEIQGVFAAARDITDRKKMEEELRQSKELLEKLNQHLNEIREEERASISREIHDELGQSMTALKLDLNRLQKYLNTNPEAMGKLEGMVELVSNTIKDVQRISSDLRPGILDELGLVSAIEWYCDEFEKRTGIKCNLELENSDIDDSQVSLTFFRVLQETLTNVIRHAKASIVKVTLHQTYKGTTLVVKDNGIGIPGSKIDSNQSLGLISMRERMRQFNGTIDILSKTGKGTKLTFFIPS